MHSPRHRRPSRVDVNYQGILINADGQEVAVVVRDLSAFGFRIELHDEVLAGERVELRVGKGRSMAAEIRWALGSEAGGVFLDRTGLS